MEMFDIMKHGLPGEVIENRVEGDDRFVVQGEDYRGEGQRTYMIGYSLRRQTT